MVRETREEKQRKEKRRRFERRFEKKDEGQFEHYAKHLIHILLYDIYSIRLVHVYKYFFAFLSDLFDKLYQGSGGFFLRNWEDKISYFPAKGNKDD